VNIYAAYVVNIMSYEHVSVNSNPGPLGHEHGFPVMTIFM